MTKARYFPTECKKQSLLDGYAEVAISHDTKNGVRAIGYSGKRLRFDFHYVFRSENAASTYIEKWVAGLEAAQKNKQNKKETKRNFTHDFKVGDLLCSSWGYDQTNVDFFQVVEVVSGKSIKISEIQGECSEEIGFCTAYKKPIVDAFVGKVMLKRVNHLGYVRINDVCVASRYEKSKKGKMFSWYA